DAVTQTQLASTPRAKKVIEFAIDESRNLNQNYVGTEHLLLGLIREEEGVAAQILMNLGLRLETVREQVLNLLGRNEASPEIKRSPTHADLNAEIPNLPNYAQAIVKMFDAQLELLQQGKENAVAE